MLPPWNRDLGPRRGRYNLRIKRWQPILELKFFAPKFPSGDARCGPSLMSPTSIPIVVRLAPDEIRKNAAG
jgi:hypothetical protein